MGLPYRILSSNHKQELLWIHIETILGNPKKVGSFGVISRVTIVITQIRGLITRFIKPMNLQVSLRPAPPPPPRNRFARGC